MVYFRMSWHLYLHRCSLMLETWELRRANLSSRDYCKRRSPSGTHQKAYTIIDGSAILYMVHWPVNGTVGDFVANVKTYIQHKLTAGDVYLVFDRYRDFYTKSCKWPDRDSSASGVHQLRQHMKLHQRTSSWQFQQTRSSSLLLFVKPLSKISNSINISPRQIDWSSRVKITHH